MPNATETLEFFDPATASDREFEALLAFTNGLRSEMTPDDPPTPLAEAIAAWRATSPLMNNATWLVRSGEGEVLARGHAAFANIPENRHLVQASIQVRADRRRQGLGRRLLGSIAARMRENGRTLAMAATSDRAPGGAAFLERLGAERGLEGHVHQLAIAELDRTVLAEWQARARERAEAFESGFWDGPFPEDQLEAIAALHEVMNTQPTGSLAVEHQRYTPELLRTIEQDLFGRGIERRVMYVRERASGRFAGFTEVYWKPGQREDVLNQGNTGVFPEFRGRGLGRWLKAAMLERALAEHPEVRFVRTSNADSNAAMLRLNQALGFRPYLSRTVWQMELAKIESYLRESAA